MYKLGRQQQLKDFLKIEYEQQIQALQSRYRGRLTTEQYDNQELRTMIKDFLTAARIAEASTNVESLQKLVQILGEAYSSLYQIRKYWTLTTAQKGSLSWFYVLKIW